MSFWNNEDEAPDALKEESPVPDEFDLTEDGKFGPGDPAEDDLLWEPESPRANDVVSVKRVAHAARADELVIALERDFVGNIVGFYLVSPEVLEERYSEQQLMLDGSAENVYNGLVQYIDNQVPNLKVEALNGVLLQLARAGIGILPDDLDPQKHSQLIQKLNRNGIKL